jgi:hypothetical protein
MLGVTNINNSGSQATNIGNATSPTNIVGVTTINTGSSATNTTIGNSASATNVIGSTSINTGSSAASTNIGNSVSTTTILGTTNINTGSSATDTTIGNASSDTKINGNFALSAISVNNSLTTYLAIDSNGKIFKTTDLNVDNLSGNITINATGTGSTRIGNLNADVYLDVPFTMQSTITPAYSIGLFDYPGVTIYQPCYYLVVDVDTNKVFKTNSQVAPDITSSRRLKKNIQKISSLNTQDIYNLEPVEFEYKNNSGRKHYGLIAEDVDQIESLKFAVLYNDDGLPQALDYNSIIFLPLF